MIRLLRQALRWWSGASEPVRPASIMRPASSASAVANASGPATPAAMRLAASLPGGDTRARIFDPEVIQYPEAFRLGEPTFADDAQARRWREAQQQAMARVLAAIAASPWKDRVVLRGSQALRAWFGAAARTPKDIDLIALPGSMRPDDQAAAELLEELLGCILGTPVEDGLALDVSRTARDELWAYDDLPGRRLAIPWTAPGIPGGTVQIDVAFGEIMPDEPVDTRLQDGTVLLTASRPLSLAWKLLWLEREARGKDLYDAVLLAEATELPRGLLLAVLAAGDIRRPEQLGPDFPLRWQVDWTTFQAEHPRIAGGAQDWQERLRQALAPTFR